jgi:hypothetical protein
MAENSSETSTIAGNVPSTGVGRPRGMRVHATTRMRPAVVFSAEEAPALCSPTRFGACPPSHEVCLHTSVS